MTKSIEPVISANEIVTHFPTPSRLGMVRFERMDDDSWTMLFMDSSCEKQLGFSIPKDTCFYASLMDPSSRYSNHRLIRQQLQQGNSYRISYYLSTPEKQLQIVEVGERVQLQGRPALRGYLLAFGKNAGTDGRPDTTPASTLSQLEQLMKTSPTAQILLKATGKIEYINPALYANFRFMPKQMEGQHINVIAPGGELEDLFQPTSVLMQNARWLGEVKGRYRNGDTYWALLSITEIPNSLHMSAQYYCILENITQSKLNARRADQLIYTDPLTGLDNRISFISKIERLFKDNPDLSADLLILDIDNFKRINDNLGHELGDKLLSTLSRRIRNCFADKKGLLSRFSGTEFAILLEEDNGAWLAEKLLYSIEKPVFINDQLINTTASIGMASSPSHGHDSQTLMRHASIALHKAKVSGKHQLQIFTENIKTETRRKLFIENNLHLALKRNELSMAYQPQVDLKTGCLTGLEALVRWNHPEEGSISPGQFIGEAEETGLIVPIGKWIISQACQHAKVLKSQGFSEVTMAINLSPRQFADPDLAGYIAAIMHDLELPGEYLEMEITEGLLLDASKETRAQLDCLKGLGLRLSMDDFGTGYSSLSNLKRYPIDEIKIDQGFVSNIPNNSDDIAIISAVIAMAHELKLTVVAEGIETMTQLNLLREQNCDIGQGFLFDRPIPADRLLQTLDRYQNAIEFNP